MAESSVRAKAQDRLKREVRPLSRKPRFTKAYSFALVTGALFVFAWVGQFVAQYFAFRNEEREHGEQFEWAQFLPEFFTSTLENWQSEALQLVWQVVGLAIFYFWGSSQSRESDERIEAKLDALLRERGIDPT